MAGRRQQLEMERVFKKIDELAEAYDRWWQLMQDPQKQPQKEKHENELKKELKKLQRLREQVKAWQLDKSIRVKTKLVEYRRKVEERMELFKDWNEADERCRPYSNLGLMRIENDPEKHARALMEKWICDCLDILKQKCDSGEAEIEELIQGKKKRNEKRTTEIRERLRKHMWHVKKLEMVLRSLRNQQVDMEKVADLRESVEYYVNNHGDTDFMEDDEMYDEIEGEIERCGNTIVAQRKVESEAPKTDEDKACPLEKNDGNETAGELMIETVLETSTPPTLKVRSSKKKTKSAKKPCNDNQNKSTKPLTYEEALLKSIEVKEGEIPTQPQLGEDLYVEFPLLPNATPKTPEATQVDSNEKQPLFTTIVKEQASFDTAHTKRGTTFSARRFATLRANNSMRRLVDANGKVGNAISDLRPIGGCSNITMTHPSISTEETVDNRTAHFEAEQIPEEIQKLLVADDTGETGTLLEPCSVPVIFPSNEFTSTPMSSYSQKPGHTLLSTVEKGMWTFAETSPGQLFPELPHFTPKIEERVHSGPSIDELSRSRPTAAGSMPEWPALNAHPLSTLGRLRAREFVREKQNQERDCPLKQITNDKKGWWSKLSRKELVALFELESGLLYFPKQEGRSDGPSFEEAIKLLKLPDKQIKLEQYDEVYYQRLNDEALFFAVHHQPGTERCLDAAYELIRRGWRYHSLFKRWFRRLGDPKFICDTFEVSCVAYFDCDPESWCQRLKENFIFEYCYLENDLTL